MVTVEYSSVHKETGKCPVFVYSYIFSLKCNVFITVFRRSLNTEVVFTIQYKNKAGLKHSNYFEQYIN